MGRLVAGMPVPLPLWCFDPDDPRAPTREVWEADGGEASHPGGPRKAAPTALILIGRYVQPQHLSNFSTTEFRIDQSPNPKFPASSANVCLRGGEPSTDRESPTTSVTSNSPPRSRTQYRSGRTFAPPIA